MNKTLILFCFFLSMGNVFSSEKKEQAVLKIQGTKEMPLELNFLVGSLVDNIGYEKILPIILNIDSYARLLSKENIFLIGKVEIYKTLLKYSEYYPKAIIDSASLTTLKTAIKKSKDPFLKWFLQAILQDSQSLLDNPKFKDYVLQKNTGKIVQIEHKKIDKKVQILYRWISKINTENTDFQELLKNELLPVMMDALSNIEESFFLMASATGYEPIPVLINSGKDLKFFKIMEKIVLPKPTITEKSVDDILDPVTSETMPADTRLPEPSKDDWLNEDNAPFDLKNLPKPSDDADWLQDF